MADAVPRPEAPAAPRRWAPLLLGVVIAAVAVGLVVLRPAGFRERELTRALASSAEVDAWVAEGDRRGKPFESLPDPPGDGVVVSAKYWIALPPYEMEVRRRGRRVTLGIRGTDVQVLGGAWVAFAEGTIDGDPATYRGAHARVGWSCVGLRHRVASDGVARLDFSRDGREVEAVYLQAYEMLLEPSQETYMKAYGRVAEGAKPPYGALHGQIPYLPPLARHRADERVVVSGVVRTPEGEWVPDALVQLKGVDRTRVHADAEGRFRFEMRGSDAPWTQSVCAGAVGFRNGETVLFTGDRTDAVIVELTRIDPTDHPEYAWVHPAPDRDPENAQACGTCHSWQYAEWIESRHARMADSGHVLFERQRMREQAPDAPDDCAACHQPAWAAQSKRGEYVPRGVLAANHCDFCHKAHHVEDVRAPGVFGSLVLARPDPSLVDRPGSIHRVFGPAPDVSFAPMGASWNPMLSTSFLCAGCHEGGGLPGRPKVDTFEEWRAWAAGREDESFRSCQDCHMPAGVTRTESGKAIDQFAWESLHRRPSAVHSHAFLGSVPSFARPALGVDVEKRYDSTLGRWTVRVAVTNTGAGHKVPTGTWTKHVAIGVWARQGDVWLPADGGERAALVPPSTAPAGPLVGGDWRNPPGALLGVFGKGTPGAPLDFYDPPPAEDVVDTRLAPGETRTVSASFVPLGEGPGIEPRVEVRVVHRRGAIGAGPHETPWEPRPYDAPPQAEWLRIER